MKQKLLNILKCILFLGVLGVCVIAASIVLQRKESRFKYADFFDKAAQDQIDVLFMGSSHVINGYNPAVLFEEYGITSYNMGGHGSVMQATYWELIEALDYCTPKYVVVDSFLMHKDYQYLDVMEENAGAADINTSIEQLHLNMDCWPLNKLKVAAIRDLIKDPAKQMQFLFDMTVYHDRWKELNGNDYKTLTGNADRNELFGAEMRYGVELTPGFYPDPPNGEGLETHTVGEEYLMKIIDECQRRNIGVIVTSLPCSATTTDKRAAVSAGITAGRYEVPFVDMMNMDIVDLYADMNDTGHLNATGSVKVTRCIGDVLAATGEFDDHRGDPAYEDWQRKSDSFYEELGDKACYSENLYEQLNYLSAVDEDCIVYINQDSDAFHDGEFERLLGNISGTGEFAKSENGPYIMIRDGSGGERAIYESRDEGNLSGVRTALGTLNYQPVEKMFRLLYADENPDVNYLYDDGHLEYDIQIIVYDDETGEVKSHNYFRSYGNDYER